MRPGDDVLFAEKGTGLFTRYAQVTYKPHSREFGASLWPFVGANPWEYIYFLRNVRRIHLDKPDTVALLGYERTFAVAGATRVSDDRLERFERQYGSVTEWLEIFANHDDLTDAAPLREIPAFVPNTGPTSTKTLAERRRLHNIFAGFVKEQYGYACALCGINDASFLVAGHISPWASDEANRLNLANGICLCVLHDRAFERKYLVLNDNLRVVLTSRLDRESALGKLLAQVEGVKLREPIANAPDRSLLQRHRERLS